MGLFSGRQADADKPELGPADAFDDDASREAAERTERENPGWIVVFGVFTKEFVCFPRFPGSGWNDHHGAVSGRHSTAYAHD